MSDDRVIDEVDETLIDLLWSRIQPDAEISGIIGTMQQISREPPFKLVTDTNPDRNALSLFLYRIVENGNMKNQPLEARANNILRYPPLALDLFYLVTPITNTTENDHRLFGKVMQVFHDNAILRGPALQGGLQNTAELRITLEPMSLEDTTKLWSSFMRSYHLSVSYQVRVIYIDSERETQAVRVSRRRTEYTEKKT